MWKLAYSLHVDCDLCKTAEEAPHEDVYDLTFACPTGPVHLFHGDAYLATNVAPFTSPPPDSIICSRNRMEHILVRDPASDGSEHKGYRDKKGSPLGYSSQKKRVAELFIAHYVFLLRGGGRLWI